MKIEIERLVPRFIMNDKNGYAIAKAIEAGFIKSASIVETGKKLMNDYDSMPEWRLDEVAWETGCIYNYNADIEQKREFIKNSVKSFGLYGTPSAILLYLRPFFDTVDIREDASPYHFGIFVDGDIDFKNLKFAIETVNKVKNARSVFDGIFYEDHAEIALTGHRRAVLDEFVLDIDEVV